MVGMGWPGRRPGRGQARGHGGVSIGDPPRLGQPDREIQGSQQSSLEESGFEPSVPPLNELVSPAGTRMCTRRRSRRRRLCSWDQGFESAFLQHRVKLTPNQISRFICSSGAALARLPICWALAHNPTGPEVFEAPAVVSRSADPFASEHLRPTYIAE
jgi:hypothetical protein